MSRKEKNTKTKSKKKVLLIVVIIVVILLGVIGGFVLNIFSRYNYNELDKEDIGINVSDEESSLSRPLYKNIALFGIDTRGHDFSGLSDCIMILTLDYEHGSIKISSIMRDSLVQIEGHGYEKETHAYSYGGAQLAVKTINTNYDMDIKEYITINFDGMERVINKLRRNRNNLKRQRTRPFKRIYKRIKFN